MIRTIRIFQIQLLKSLGTVQFWAPFALAFGAVINAALPLSEITAHYSYPVNAFSAAFLLSDRLTAFTIFLGVFILFSEIPFRDNNQTLLLARSGKRPWIFGQVLYVIAVSVIYFTCIFAFYCLILAGRMDFSAGNWGKVVNTISATNISETFGLRIQMPQNVLSAFSPIKAFLVSFSLAIFISITLGIVVLSLNLIVGRSSGLFVSGFFIFLRMFLDYINAIHSVMFYFSPVGWCSLILLDKNGSSPLPSASYAVTVLGIVSVLLIALLFGYGSKRIKFSLDEKGK